MWIVYIYAEERKWSDGHASNTIHHLLQSQAANLNQMKSLSLSNTLIQGIKRMKMNVNRTLTSHRQYMYCVHTFTAFKPVCLLPQVRKREQKSKSTVLQIEKRLWHSNCVQHFYPMDDIDIDIPHDRQKSEDEVQTYMNDMGAYEQQMLIKLRNRNLCRFKSMVDCCFSQCSTEEEEKSTSTGNNCHRSPIEDMPKIRGLRQFEWKYYYFLLLFLLFSAETVLFVAFAAFSAVKSYTLPVEIESDY